MIGALHRQHRSEQGSDESKTPRRLKHWQRRCTIKSQVRCELGPVGAMVRGVTMLTWVGLTVAAMGSSLLAAFGASWVANILLMIRPRL